MFGIRKVSARRAREQGEKPFWISFSDLMSALMVLFLVAMSVALLAVTKKVSEEERLDKERVEAIDRLMTELEKVVELEEFKGIRVIRNTNTIDFGPMGRFEREGQNTLSPSQRELVLRFTPKLLDKLRSTDAGLNWFTRAVVEGYASPTGKYLFNLNLSLERSERVICELLHEPPAGEAALSLKDRKLIATKFVVGGASFNKLITTADGSVEDSRRIEFRLDFKTRQERKAEQEKIQREASDSKGKPHRELSDAQWTQALDPKERCPLLDR